MRLNLLALVATLIAAPALAQSVANGVLTPTGPGEARVTLDVTLPASDTLTGVSSPLASGGMVHTVRRRGAGAVMVSTSLALRGGVVRHLSVRGDHLMLTGLAPVRSGDTVPLVLSFAHHAPIAETALVR